MSVTSFQLVRARELISHTLNGRKAQLLGHIGVLDLAGLVEGHTADELSQVAGGGDSRATAEGLEDNVVDDTRVLVDADLQLHDIATSGSTNQTGTDVLVTLLHGTDIARVVVVVQDLLMVTTALDRGKGGGTTLGRLNGLQGREGCKSTRRNSTNTGSDGDKTLEHFEIVDYRKIIDSLGLC